MRRPTFLDDKRRRYSSCLRKKAYNTTKDATRAIHHSKYNGTLDYYQCPYCGKYHLTKKYVQNKFQPKHY